MAHSAIIVRIAKLSGVRRAGRVAVLMESSWPENEGGDLG